MCGKSFRLKHHLTRHILIHIGDKPHSCETLGYHLHRHPTSPCIRWSKVEKNLIVVNLVKSFMTKSSITKHMLIHTGDKPYCCKTCGKLFTHKYHLTGHMLIMSPPFRVGRHIVFARVVCLSIHPSVCPSQNRVRSVTWKPFEIFSWNFI